MAELTNVPIPPAQVERINKIMANELDKFIDELPKLINEHLITGVLHALGFKRRWGSEVEVDGSNGRTSLVMGLLQDRSKHLEPMIGEVVDAALMVVLNDKKFHKAVAEYAVSEFKHKMWHQIGNITTKMAQVAADRVVSATFAGVPLELVDFVPGPLDIEDPKAFEYVISAAVIDKIGKLVSTGKADLKRTVKNGAAQITTG